LSSDALATLTAELRSVNEALREIEDLIRGCERAGDFGPKFVELARSVYQNNDSRAAIKRKINVLLEIFPPECLARASRRRRSGRPWISVEHCVVGRSFAAGFGRAGEVGAGVRH
jgi:hypothetical protein